MSNDVRDRYAPSHMRDTHPNNLQDKEMASGYLYERITKGRPGSVGTLAEPEGTPEPRFALQSTVNWMHALVLLTQNSGIDWRSMIARYAHVQRFTGLTDRAANTIYEQLLMSIHHLSALRAMEQSSHLQDLSRIGVMTWYYGIYCAASAMIAAKDGSQQ